MRLLSYLSAPSSLAVIITIIMVVAELFTNEGDEPFGSAGTVGPPPGTTFFQAYGGLTTIVFAYLGQDVFCEIMQEMAEPKDANKSINLAYSVMTLVYAFTTIVAYGLEGRSVEGFLLDSLPDSPVKRVASGLLAFHVIVAYAIVSVPLTNFFYGLCFPNTPIHDGGVPARLRWALISIGYLVFSYLIATLIPAFSAIQGLIGSLCGSPILFGFPAAFYILACRLNKKKISTFDKVTCALFLCVLCPLFFLCGTIDSIMQIGDAVKDAGTPFSIC
ncbi:hypothetical protein EMIHUDRAFT_420217 [Emiliania huxleyi CCMP1516]|uniref:Amino acid transporter transmembrane domain-containing protein n=2 Tax=Emiliania huxleyi TaxID=2903 RepID=A0A0D3L0U7_EMIH1|nr:hypothetical protein EMIHUDRAFT_420217 [Emiliania huxleyi CCMP1516]EOD41632.1 hypothetical protein EMIHUDRAFT_420217 [Emiliania huxleyi CCMP1516]|eukprot:XP_005794061.1 hypothetical protein EMIHUDRAFT_420217 [Emiliania huxleyi CCMP1516]